MQIINKDRKLIYDSTENGLSGSATDDSQHIDVESSTKSKKENKMRTPGKNFLYFGIIFYKI